MPKEIAAIIVKNKNIRNGRPIISGTGITVHRIAIWYNLGHSPEEIVANLPHLTLTNVFAALTYYFQHKQEIGLEIKKENELAEMLESQFEKTSKAA